MLNFEEELKKFRPSMEVEDVEEAVRSHELTDMTDIMVEMLQRQKENISTPPPAVNTAINANMNTGTGIIQ